ncbi:MAG TPA: PEGA domain-containing protein [Labilithrix sp.]|nr:PEGA domain-containing protein [Labilithrix sp.]
MLSASKRRSISFVLATALLAPSLAVVTETAAIAQPAKKKPLREQLPEDAKKHWDTAVALYQRGQWDGARTSFNAAFDASKNPRVLFNVAVCEKNLGRYARAIDVFKKELAEGKGQLSAEEETDVKAQIAGLEQFVASVTIDVSESGADVYVDDAKVGVSPLPGPVSVSVGERHIRVSKVGFADARETIELKAGASGKIALKLSATQKTSLVNVAVVGPPNAVVKIDGREVGAAPYKGQVNVSAEPHSFSAEANDYVTATQSAVVRDGEVLNLTLQLSQQQSKGKLIVAAKPEGSTIEIDGKVVGSTRWEGPVEVGTHQVVVKKQGHYTWSYDVEVPKGGERSLTASLNEDRNTSFVPWLIGTVLVVGASTTAIYFITKPKDEQPVKGTLAPFAVGTPAMRF